MNDGAEEDPKVEQYKEEFERAKIQNERNNNDQERWS